MSDGPSLLATPEKPRRRWYQFGLPSVLIVVTLVAMGSAFAAYELNWIRQRRALLTETIRALAERPISQEIADKPAWRVEGTRTAPGLLWLFGERGVISLEHFVVQERPNLLVTSNTADFDVLTELLPGGDLARARALFPEAHVHVGGRYFDP